MGKDLIIENDDQLRLYFKEFIDIYVSLANVKKIPVDSEKLEQIINNAEIKFIDMENTTGTFAVSKNRIEVIKENFYKNGKERNDFLLLHEFTHLNSAINEEIFSDQMGLFQKLSDIAAKKEGENISGINAYYGITAVDEVLAQWVCDELNDSLKNQKRETFEYLNGPLNSDINYKSDFSNGDIYSPLEKIVEMLIQSIGYIDLKDFANDFLASNRKLVNLLNDDTFDMLCNIGVVCQGIYKEQGFMKDITVTKEDIENAYKSIVDSDEKQIH